MIVDTSAIMAIVLNEEDSEYFLREISRASPCRMSVGTWIELGVVVQRRYPQRADAVEKFTGRAGLILEPVSVEHAEIARTAFAEFGQNSGHRARLNFGDCFAYALAKATGEPLLFKGDDFVHTDIATA